METDLVGMKTGKAIVLGLDGATWNLLGPYMDQGTMPNLLKIVTGGASGILSSTVPPYTAPAWVSCVTGVNPGKHGIFGFINREGAVKKDFVGSRDVRFPKLWHFINGAGKRAGMINIPITYPAEAVQGFVIPDFLTPLGKEDYTYPVSIYKEFLKPIDYVINVRIADIQDFSGGVFLKVIDDLKSCTEKRYRAMKALEKAYSPEFLMIVFTCFDKVQHKFYKYLDPGHPMYESPEAEKVRPHLLSIYSQIDGIIGRILDDMDDDTTLYIVSDHGFCSLEKIFFINKWLHTRGYLDIRTFELLKSRFLSRYRKKGKYSSRNIDVFSPPSHNFINEDGTLFLGSDPYEQGIYYTGRPDNGEYRNAVSRLKGELNGLKDPGTGDPLFENVYHRDELYTGGFRANSPDIILKMKNYEYGFAVGFPLKNRFLREGDKPSGTHHPAGVFAAYGKGIACGVKKDASIMDIAPTVLFNMGLPVHREMDGKVLKDIFSRKFQDEHAVEYADSFNERNGTRGDFAYSDDEKKEITGRLRELGYFD